MTVVSTVSSHSPNHSRCDLHPSNLGDRHCTVANAMLVNPTALKQPVSLLLIWGTADPINPFNGGTVKRSGQQRV